MTLSYGNSSSDFEGTNASTLAASLAIAAKRNTSDAEAVVHVTIRQRTQLVLQLTSAANATSVREAVRKTTCNVLPADECDVTQSDGSGLHRRRAEAHAQYAMTFSIERALEEGECVMPDQRANSSGVCRSTAIDEQRVSDAVHNETARGGGSGERPRVVILFDALIAEFEETIIGDGQSPGSEVLNCSRLCGAISSDEGVKIMLGYGITFCTADRCARFWPPSPPSPPPPNPPPPPRPPPSTPPSPPPPAMPLRVECEGGTCSQQLQQALEWARSTNATGLPVVIHIANGTYQLDGNAPEMTFNAGTTASEVRLIGEGGALLTALEDSEPLLTVSTGAPFVTLFGLVIQSLVAVHGGSAMIDRCRFEGSSAARGGLAIRDGSVRVQRSEFMGDVTHLEGGAINVSGGTLEMVDSTLTVVGGALAVCCHGRVWVQQAMLTGNVAPLGAITVSGGFLEITNSTLMRNVAEDPEGGGALHVSGGSVILKAKTLFLENRAAGVSQSVFVQAGSVIYTLPTPLGRWIPSFLTEPTIQLTLPQHGTADFPFACAPGIIGDSDKTESQSGPWCNGRCPAGYLCREATIVPEICPAGGYCSEGSPALSMCEDGTYGNGTGLTSQSNCTACPRGHSCRRGELQPLPCQPGYVAPDANMGACAACKAGTFQALSGQTECLICDRGSYCETGATFPHPCPGKSSPPSADD